MTAAAHLEAEEQARAHCYAVIGGLMYGVAEASLLSHIAQQLPPEGAAPLAENTVPLARAWQALQLACRDADVGQVRLEYDDLFVGVGKAPVTLYTSAYAAPQGPDRHLLALRDTLDGLGLARRTGAGETEDHVAALCDVMRWLIESARGLAAERRFFGDFVAPAMEPLCRAIATHPQARFYRAVADYMRAFCEVERMGFELAGMEGD